MFAFSKVFSKRVGNLLVLGTLIIISNAAAISWAQKSNNENPAFSDFKGVRIGTPTDEARKKLGSPRDKSDEQDFYVFNDTQAVQIFYDKTAKVTAISIDYMNGANSIPTAKDILGEDAEKRADGSLYKLVRYPKAGYWVSYSRTAGDSPTTTVTMQKIEH